MADETQTKYTAAGEWGEEIAPRLVQISDDHPFYWGVYHGNEVILFADGKPGKRHFFLSPHGENEVIIGTTQLNTTLSRADIGDAVVIELTGEMRARSGNMVKQFSVKSKKPNPDGSILWPDGMKS